jgi:hypothetical protein
MSFTRFTTLATILIGMSLASCDKGEEGTSEPKAETTKQAAQAPEQPAQASDTKDVAAKGTSKPTMMDELRTGCPMAIDGTTVDVSDSDDGVALTFTTKAADTSELRARVESMAHMYETHDMHGGMMWHHMGGHMGSGMGHMGGQHIEAKGPMPATTCTVTDVDGGARLELKPKDASDLESLREHVRWHQQRMQGGECWMLQKSKAPPAEESK